MDSIKRCRERHNEPSAAGIVSDGSSSYPLYAIAFISIIKSGRGSALTATVVRVGSSAVMNGTLHSGLSSHFTFCYPRHTRCRFLKNVTLPHSQRSPKRHHSGCSNAVGPTAILLRFHSPIPSPAMDGCASVARAVLGNRVSTTAGPVCVGTRGTLLIPVECARSVESCGNRPSVCVATSGPGMTPGMCGMMTTMIKEERGTTSEERKPRWRKGDGVIGPLLNEI